jgi:hypothetical protein
MSLTQQNNYNGKQNNNQNIKIQNTISSSNLKLISNNGIKI